MKKIILFLTKVILICLPLVIILNLFLTPEQRQSNLERDIIFIYFVIVLFIFKPALRKFLLFFSAFIGLIILMSESGLTSEDLDQWWVKCIFVLVGLPLYFFIISVLAKKSNNPKIKELYEKNKFSNDELKWIVILAVIILFFGLIYLTYKVYQ